VPLILNDDFLGSGVLVEVDNVPGVLTAEHVVNNSAAPFDNSLESKQALVTSVSERANTVAVEMRHLTWWTTTRQTDEWGPDLAFIRLPESAGFTRQLRASKSFYNLTLDPKNRMEEALDSSGFMAFVGYGRTDHGRTTRVWLPRRKTDTGLRIPDGTGKIPCSKRLRLRRCRLQPSPLPHDAQKFWWR
jgi:hypothetical protein